MENELTTIPISKNNRQRLGALGNKNENLNDIITKILDFYEEGRMNDALLIS